MQTDDIAVRIKPPGRTWQRYDADPESPVLTANAYGPDQASIALRRDLRIPWGDLAAFTPIEIDIAGVTVWDGRLKDTPGRDWDATLNAEGWQYALDDVPIRRLYVHNRLGDYKDARSFLTANLADYTTGWNIATDGAISFTFPGPLRAAGGWPKAGVVLDTGITGGAKKVAIDWERNAAWAGACTAYLSIGQANPFDGAGGGGTITSVSGGGGNTGTYLSGTLNGRYVLILVDANTVQDAAAFFRLNAVRVFGDTTYQSAGTSILTADDVITDSLTEGAAFLSSDLSQIAADTFAIPSLGLPSFQTPRELIDGVNALRNNIIRVGVDRRLTWKERPTAPLFHVGAWSDYQFEDASLNNGGEIYDQVAVTGTAADGTQAVYENTQTVPLLAMTGTTKKKIVTVDAPLDSSVGDRIGQTFLETHRTSSLNGTVAVAGADAIRDGGGSSVHPSLLLRASQELIRLDDRVDPDTGGVGRNGMISTVEYRHDTRTAVVSLDNTRRSWDAALARYNLVAGAATGA